MWQTSTAADNNFFFTLWSFCCFSPQPTGVLQVNYLQLVFPHSLHLLHCSHPASHHLAPLPYLHPLRVCPPSPRLPKSRVEIVVIFSSREIGTNANSPQSLYWRPDTVRWDRRCFIRIVRVFPLKLYILISWFNFLCNFRHKNVIKPRVEGLRPACYWNIGRGNLSSAIGWIGELCHLHKLTVFSDNSIPLICFTSIKKDKIRALESNQS